MINTKDLRIGNLIQYNPKQVDDGVKIIPLKVTSVSVDDKITVDDGFTNLYDSIDFDPVLLNSEILEKAGFKKLDTLWSIKYHNCYKDCYFCLFQPKYGVSFYLRWQYKRMPVLYLHQLQNLYAALTGEELTITH